MESLRFPAYQRDMSISYVCRVARAGTESLQSIGFLGRAAFLTAHRHERRDGARAPRSSSLSRPCEVVP